MDDVFIDDDEEDDEVDEVDEVDGVDGNVEVDEVSVGDIERSSYNLRNRHPLSNVLH